MMIAQRERMDGRQTLKGRFVSSVLSMAGESQVDAGMYAGCRLSGSCSWHMI